MTPQTEDGFRASGTLVSFDPLPHPSSLLALRLRQADGYELEVLADAPCTLQQLSTAFGCPEGALDQEVKLSLDVFGFPALRKPHPAETAQTAGQG